MAVLKDLIVHGRSRFVNGIDADSIHANLIDANDGVFKTITTTTLDAETITTDMLTAQNARVAQTLTVDGTISTNKWEAANIANIGGNFYISPTGKADSGNITVTKTGTTTINGMSVGVYTLVVGSASFGVTSTSSTIWGTSSKVIFTGSIAYNSSKKYPLGTCNGTMTSVSTGSSTLTGFTITGVNSPALDIFFKEQGITSVSNTACTGYEMQISVYQSYYSSALHPIGILLTSYGKDKKQYIDIYGGANTLGDSASGFANPSVRIGQLDGLPNIVDGSTDSTTAPSGWGIYTDNGFFKGKIVSNAGKIGGFTIGSTDIHNGKTSRTETTNNGVWVGTDGIGFGKGVTYFSLDGTGKIGPWTLSTTALYNGSTGINNTSSGVYLGYTTNNTGLNISGGSAATTITIANSNFTKTINGTSYSTLRVAIGSNFGMDSSGNIYANGANITSINAGNITAGDIAAARIQTNLITAINAKVSDISALTATLGGFQVDSTAIHTNGVAITSNADNSIALSSADFTRTINNTSRAGLRFAIGDKFGVTGDGSLYASEAVISGAINAATLSTGSKTSATAGTGTYINSSGEIYVGSGSTNNFTVSSTGILTATSAELKGLKIYDTSNNLRADFSTSLNLYGGTGSTESYPRTTIDSDGITIAYSANNYIDITTINELDEETGEEVPKGYLTITQEGAEVARFGEYTTIGFEGGFKTDITPNNFSIINGDDLKAIDIVPEGSEVTRETQLMVRGRRRYHGTRRIYDYYNRFISGNTYTVRLYDPSTTYSSDEEPETDSYTVETFTPSRTSAQTVVVSQTNCSLTIYFEASQTQGNEIIQWRGRCVSNISTASDYFPRYEIWGPLTFSLPRIDMDAKVYCTQNIYSEGRLYAGYNGDYPVWLGRGYSNGAWTGRRGVYDSKTSQWMICATADSTTRVHSGFTAEHRFCPGKTSTNGTNGIYLGDSTYRWNRYYGYTADNISSDRKIKEDINAINYAKDFIMQLKPVEYYLKDSDHNRKHMGFIAQDVAEIGKQINQNLSVYEAEYIDESKGEYHGEPVDDSELTWGLMYTEMIAPLVQVVQDQQHEIENLKKEIEQLKK